MKKILLGALGLLALAVIPVSGYAQMPGQPCPGVAVGTTKMADDKQSIIGCLLTSSGEQKWKSTIGGASDDWQCDGSGDLFCVRMTDGLFCTLKGGLGWYCVPDSPLNWPGDKNWKCNQGRCISPPSESGVTACNGGANGWMCRHSVLTDSQGYMLRPQR